MAAGVSLAAVVIVAISGTIDISALRDFYAMNRVELLFSVGTTLGVLVLGVLPGVLLAVILTLPLLLAINAKPTGAGYGGVS